MFKYAEKMYRKRVEHVGRSDVLGIVMAKGAA
jgi:hypothetical protein